MLLDAWNLFAKYDGNAKIQQKQFRQLQTTLLALGVVGTLLAILATQLSPTLLKQISVPALRAFLEPFTNTGGPVYKNPLKIALALVTAFGSGLLTTLNRSRPGEKWLLLRAGAQSVAREIYVWRAQAGAYRDQPDASLLYHKLNGIAKGLENIVVQEVKFPSLPPRSENPDEDDKQSFLTPEQYLRFRVDDQQSFYQSRIARLNQQAHRLHLVSIFASVIGTILAVLGVAAWVPLTTALTTACMSHLQQRQIETTLVQYNLSYNSLSRLQMWWKGELSEADRALPANIDKMVTSTEEILEAELTSWTQKLNAAMAKLYTSAAPEAETASVPPAHIETEGGKAHRHSPAHDIAGDKPTASAVVVEYAPAAAPASPAGEASSAVIRTK